MGLALKLDPGFAMINTNKEPKKNRVTKESVCNNINFLSKKI